VSDDCSPAPRVLTPCALERGKSVAQDAVQAASDTAQDRGRDEADELKTSVKEASKSSS
jgi:hypothetical protein